MHEICPLLIYENGLFYRSAVSRRNAVTAFCCGMYRLGQQANNIATRKKWEIMDELPS